MYGVLAMINKKTKYALQAMILLAQEYDRGPVLIADLAARGRIPHKFLELILLSLKNAGLLQSRKGKGGGYSLGRPPDQITMGEVIRIVEGPLAPVPCVSKIAYRRCEECVDERTCGIRLVMQEVRDGIANILDGATFADVLKRIKRAERAVKRKGG
jgi:Rrf2 family protein